MHSRGQKQQQQQRKKIIFEKNAMEKRIIQQSIKKEAMVIQDTSKNLQKHVKKKIIERTNWHQESHENRAEEDNARTSMQQNCHVNKENLKEEEEQKN